MTQVTILDLLRKIWSEQNEVTNTLFGEHQTMPDDYYTPINGPLDGDYDYFYCFADIITRMTTKQFHVAFNGKYESVDMTPESYAVLERLLVQARDASQVTNSTLNKQCLVECSDVRLEIMLECNRIEKRLYGKNCAAAHRANVYNELSPMQVIFSDYYANVKLNAVSMCVLDMLMTSDEIDGV